MTILVSGWNLPATIPLIGRYLIEPDDVENQNSNGKQNRDSAGCISFVQPLFSFVRGSMRSPVGIVADVIDQALAESGCSRLIDLCSGAGGPIPTVCTLIHERRRRHIQMGLCQQKSEANSLDHEKTIMCILTDLYPPPLSVQRDIASKSTSSLRFFYSPHSVDATRVAADIYSVPYSSSASASDCAGDVRAFSLQERSLRTIMGAFHHFTPALATSVLRDAVRKGDAICVVELTHRSFLSMFLFAVAALMYGFIGPLLGMLPFPHSLTRLFFTYVIPIYPLAFTWDSVISCIRCYSKAEWENMVADADPQSKYTWSYRKHRIIWWFPYFFATSYTGWPKQ